MISQQLALPISGMTCIGCAANVQLALMDLPGIETVEVNLKDKRADITYNPAQVDQQQMAAAVVQAGYSVPGTEPAESPAESPARATQSADAKPPWGRIVGFGLLGMVGLALLYLGLVSLAEGWQHAVELLLEDAWIVGPIIGAFGVQVALFTWLKALTSARGAGMMAGAGGGTSTVAMAACCAHHVTDVLPLLGLSAAAAFLADYRIPFMVVGLLTNVVGIVVMIVLIVRARRHLQTCPVIARPQQSAEAHCA